MALEITPVGDELIPFLSLLPPLNERTAYVKHRSESVFDKSSDEEM